jgi:hypothetical protein
MSVGEKYSYLQLERPVLHGAEYFLAQASHIGERVLGTIATTSVTELTMISESDSGDEYSEPVPMHVTTPVEEPIFKVESARALKVILLHKRAPSNGSERYPFSYHYNRFSTPLEMVYPFDKEARQSSKNNKRTLLKQLAQISLDHEQPDPNQLTVFFDRVDIVERGCEEIVLGLFPKAKSIGQLILETEEIVCERRLRQQSKRLANLAGNSDNQSVRIGTVPSSVDRSKLDQLIERLQELTPVRLVFGRHDGRAKGLPPELDD